MTAPTKRTQKSAVFTSFTDLQEPDAFTSFMDLQEPDAFTNNIGAVIRGYQG